MRTLVHGSDGRSRPRNARQRGFTLLEMLVVLLIAGLLIAVTALAPTRNRRTDLNEEAQRLATMLESADDEAQVRSKHRLRGNRLNGGYMFYQRTEERRVASARGWAFLLGPYRWGAAVTGISIRYSGSGDVASRVVFGDESINVPVTVTLSSGAASLDVVSTGVGNFSVRRP